MNIAHKPWIEDTNYLVYEDGRIFSIISDRFLEPRFTCNYWYILLRPNEFHAKKHNSKVHRMVARMFCPNPENKKYVDHIDRNTSNNHASNLRWVNASENSRNLGRSSSSNKGVIQLSADGTEFIKEFSSIVDASKYTGISRDNIYKSIKEPTSNKKYTWKYTEPESERIHLPQGAIEIPDLPGRYITREGMVYSTRTKNYIKFPKGEYCRLIVVDKNKKNRSFFAHRLVAEFFLKNKPENYQSLEVNHKDGNKRNNHVDNLEYTTRSENAKHSASVLKKGTSKGVKFYEDDLLREFLSIKSASEYLGMSATTFSQKYKEFSDKNPDKIPNVKNDIIKDYKPQKERKTTEVKRIRKSVKVINTETGEEDIFKTTKMAAEYVGVCGTTILKWCKQGYTSNNLFEVSFV
jgi:hypothetical protein